MISEHEFTQIKNLVRQINSLPEQTSQIRIAGTFEKVVLSVLIEKKQVRVTISDRSPKNVIKELAGYLALWH